VEKEKQLKKTLAHIPFGVLVQSQQTQPKLHRTSEQAAVKRKSTDAVTGGRFGRPKEYSAKSVVAVAKVDGVPTNKPKRFDPRFTPDPNGTVNSAKFVKNYDFLLNKESEDQIFQKLRKTRDPQQKIMLTKLISALKNHKHVAQKVQLEHGVKQKWYDEQTERAKQGLKPQYIKEKELSKRVMEERFASMSEKERKKYVEKKRKRKESKTKPFIPNKRRDVED